MVDNEEWIYCCPHSDPPELAKWANTFTAYPKATLVCQEHVAGNAGHIEWSSYASADDDGSVASFITSAMGREMAHEIAIGDQRLEVHAVADKDYPRCATEPPAGTQTMVIVSRMIR
jgi:hypothetical protein